MDYSVDVSVDEPAPFMPGDTVNFTITASRKTLHTMAPRPPPIDLEVAIELTNGLSHTGTPSFYSSDIDGDPVATTYSAMFQNDEFTIGTGKATDDSFSDSVTLPVAVANDAVVNEQCLTATLTGNPPPGNGRLDDAIANNVAKLCLGDLLDDTLVSGEVDAFTVYPCVDITTAPCDSNDDVRIRAVDKTTTPERLIDPDDVTVIIMDAPVRTYDGTESGSVNSADKVSWQTATEEDDDFVGTRKGVKIGFTYAPFNNYLSSWSTIKLIYVVEGADGNPPGGLNIRSAGDGSTLFALSSGNSWTASIGPIGLTSPLSATIPWFAEFEKLGVYKMEFSVELIHGYGNWRL